MKSSLSISFKLSERRTWGRIERRVRIGTQEVHVFTSRHFLFFNIFFKNVSVGKEDSCMFTTFIKLYPIWTEWKVVTILFGGRQ